jgi:hypothetical protein
VEQKLLSKIATDFHAAENGVAQLVHSAVIIPKEITATITQVYNFTEEVLSN